MTQSLRNGSVGQTDVGADAVRSEKEASSETIELYWITAAVRVLFSSCYEMLFLRTCTSQL